MAVFNKYEVGLGNVGSYQVSARPWVKSSLAVPASASATFTEVTFPSVSKFVVIRNDEADASLMRVAFSSNGLKDSNDNYFTLSGSESFSADFKITKLYLMSDSATPTSASVIAGLTGITASRLSGSWDGLDGV